MRLRILHLKFCALSGSEICFLVLFDKRNRGFFIDLVRKFTSSLVHILFAYLGNPVSILSFILYFQNL